MKGAVVPVLLFAACAAAETEPAPVPSAAELPQLSSVPALIRPLAADYGRDGALLQGAVAYDLGDPTYAATRLELARRTEGAPPSASSLHAWVLFDAADPQAAQAVAAEGLAIYPQSAAIRAVLVEALLRQGRTAAASVALAALPAAASGDPFVLSLRARTAFAEGDYEAALHALDRLALAGPLEARMTRLRARTLEACGRPEDAVPLYEQLAARADGDPMLLEEMAFAALRAARATGDAPLYARAEILLGRVTALDPQHAGAHAGIGVCAAARGEVQRACDSWRRALELDPADVDTGLALAEALQDAGQLDEAARVLADLQRQPMGVAEHRRVRDAQRALEGGA